MLKEYGKAQISVLFFYDKILKIHCLLGQICVIIYIERQQFKTAFLGV